MPTGGRLRGAMFLLLSIFGAFTVTVAIWSIIKKGPEIRVAGPSGKEEVVVAMRDIPPGWTIKAEHLQKREMPEDVIPDEVYRKADEVVGRVAAERILAGEYIRDERLADPEAGVGLTAIIPRGMRAMQVPVANGAAVSGFLNPGNFVDIIAVCAEADPPEARTLLQSVTVLAVNDRMTDIAYVADDKRQRSRARPSVTLALEPKDAEMIKHAFGECRITLALRNDIDTTSIDSNGPPSAPAAPTAPPAPAAEAGTPPGSTG